MVRIAERASATLDFSDCECSATIAVNKALHPGVACELSDVVRVLNLPPPGESCTRLLASRPMAR
jgi:hypothetical protein